MTPSSTTTKVSYNGDGATTSFPVTFVFWNGDDLRVILRDSSGAETVWTRGTQYTVTGGGGSTGSVSVKTSPTDYTPASGETLTIRSNISLVQDTDIPSGGNLSSTNIEQQLDKIVRQNQQNDEKLDRSLKFSETSPDSDKNFPDLEASKLLRTNAAGTALEFVTLASIDGSAITTPVAESDGGTGATSLANANIAKTDTAQTFTANQTVQSSDAGAGPSPQFTLDRKSDSPAVNDVLGRIRFLGRDDGGNETAYGAIAAQIVDETGGTEDGRVIIQTAKGGSEFQGVANFQAGIFTPSESDQGADTINASQLFEAGVRVKPSAVRSITVATKTDTFTSSNTAETDVTDMTVTTPTLYSTSSKILVICFLGLVSAASTQLTSFYITDGSNNHLLDGDAASNRTSSLTVGVRNGGDNNNFGPTMIATDSPGTTTAQTYKLRFTQSAASAWYLNRNQTDSDAAATPRTASIMVAVEYE